MSKYNTSLVQVSLGLVMMAIVQTGLSQNLAPNFDFEIFTNCPPGFGQGGPLECPPWQSGTTGSTDYLHECANPAFVGVPQNYFGNQTPHSGDAYTGGYFRLVNFLYREYLQGQLISPMVAGQNYVVSFWVSLADTTCGVQDMGAYLSVSPPNSQGFGPLDVEPQIINQLGFISDDQGWTQISGCYVAVGGEQWITIGNFEDDVDTEVDPNCSISQSSYYYIDDILVEEGPPPGDIPVDIGDFASECDLFLIDPMVPDAFYHWSDGSNDPTLTVYQSGIYAVTVTDGCAFGVDSIEVEIVGSPPVDAGPPSVEICAGDSYTVSLDPDAGDYTWQDGSDESDYLITNEGVYQVTLDDGCDITTDEIVVNVNQPPAPFTLGPDTYICPGDELELDFDPTLGSFTWQDGSNNSSFTITDEGLYSLTISNPCGEETDELEITVIEPPDFTLGPDEIVLCEGQVLDLEFDPDMGVYLWQDGSDQHFYSISGPGTYALTVTNECGSASEDIDVTVLGPPVVDLGIDLLLCPAQLPFILDVGNIPGANSYTWQDGSSGSDYEVVIAGAYSITVTNDCFSASDDIEVVLDDAVPIIDLPDDQLLCEGQTFLLSANGEPGTYLWQDGSTGEEFTVTSPGTYSLTITNDCGSASDNITFDYMPALQPADLGPDVSLCPGEQYIFYANVPGVNYTWQNGSTADSLVVNSGGVYSLQISNMCSSASDTVVVTINDIPPAIDLPASQSLCQGDTIILSSGISGVQFLWNNGSQQSDLIVTAPGTYSLLVSNTCGSDADTAVIIDAGADPSVSLGADISFCEGDDVMITPVSSGVNSWLWQDGSTNNAFTASQEGLVIAQVSNNCGVDADSLTVSFLPPAPTLDLGGDTSLCPGETFDLSIAATGVNILWSDGSTTNTLNVDAAGTFFATISNSCGQASDSVIVDMLPDVPSLDLGVDQSLCPGEIIVVSPGISGVQYVWQDGSTSTSFTATQAGNVILTISNSCGLTTDTLVIVENTQGPQVNLGPDVLACEGDVVTLSAGVLGVNYLWQDGSTSADLSTSISGTFILNVSNACGADQDTVVVDIHGFLPAPFLGADTFLCDGNTLLLQSNAQAGSVILWQNGSSSPTFTVTTAGVYSLTETNHCGSGTDNISVDYQSPPPTFELGPDTTLCPGESIVLTAPLTNAQITWQDGSTGNTMVADQQQTYSLLLSNLCGTTTDLLTIAIDQRTPAITLDESIPWCQDDVITLDVTQAFVASYLWSDGSALPTFQITTPGTYAITVMTDCSSAEQEVEVVIGSNCITNDDVYVPTVFSPNGDHINDDFLVSFGSDLDITSIQCQIYDRWGTLVFQTTSLPVSWNGTFKETMANPAVYAYVIVIGYNDNGKEREQVLVGDVTLIR